jgi:hypothetical protein
MTTMMTTTTTTTTTATTTTMTTTTTNNNKQQQTTTNKQQQQQQQPPQIIFVGFFHRHTVQDALAGTPLVTNGNPEYLSPGYPMGFESALIFVSTYMFFSK